MFNAFRFNVAHHVLEAPWAFDAIAAVMKYRGVCCSHATLMSRSRYDGRQTGLTRLFGPLTQFNESARRSLSLCIECMDRIVHVASNEQCFATGYCQPFPRNLDSSHYASGAWVET